MLHRDRGLEKGGPTVTDGGSCMAVPLSRATLFLALCLKGFLERRLFPRRRLRVASIGTREGGS